MFINCSTSFARDGLDLHPLQENNLDRSSPDNEQFCSFINFLKTILMLVLNGWTLGIFIYCVSCLYYCSFLLIDVDNVGRNKVQIYIIFKNKIKIIACGVVIQWWRWWHVRPPPMLNSPGDINKWLGPSASPGWFWLKSTPCHRSLADWKCSSSSACHSRAISPMQTGHLSFWASCNDSHESKESTFKKKLNCNDFFDFLNANLYKSLR